MLAAILANFHHYNIAELITLLYTPSFYMTILSLIVLEATLSCDNAVVLAICVKHLSPKDQKHALHWGIGGAYLFRFIAIGLCTLLVKLWWVKAIGGVYLLYMAAVYFYGKFVNGTDADNDGVPDVEEVSIVDRFASKFGITIAPIVSAIITVEMMDIAFSADSVLAAFGVSAVCWVLLIGGMLGILCMRFAAQLFVKLLEKVPELETATYILITVIGGKMLVSLLGYGLEEWGFFAIMTVVFSVTFIYNKIKTGTDKMITAVGGDI